MINTPVLRQMAAAGAVTRATARGVPGGYVLAIRMGMDEQLLGAQRGGARRFRRLDALAKYIKSIGLSDFDVGLADWEPTGLL